MSLRLIAGSRRGAILATPPGEATRPTLGRVRASLFMILQYDLPGARVLDLFAGSGALGFEALSRGARQAVFVEQGRPALDALAANARKLRWTDGPAEIIPREALAWLRTASPAEPFDLIFLDPPYGLELCHQTLDLLAERLGAWLAPEGIVIAQTGRRDQLPEAAGSLTQTRQERYAETTVTFYRRLPAAAPESGEC